MFYYKEWRPTLDLSEPVRMMLVLALALVMIGGLIVLRPRVQVVQAAAAAEMETNAVAQSDAGVPAADVDQNATAAIGSGISPVFTPEVRYWEDNILVWAAEFDLDPNLVATIMQIESCGDPTAVSRAGAQGLFQVMPFHFAAGENPLDPDTNARRGLAYFVERLQQTKGDVGRAFAGYNGGHVAAAGSWDSWVAETRAYYTWTTGIYNDIQIGLTESPTIRDWQTNGGGSYCQLVREKLGLGS